MRISLIDVPPWALVNILWHRVMSTMETESIAARNVVDLLLAEKWHAGICHSPAQEGEDEQAETKEDFVYGWDC